MSDSPNPAEQEVPDFDSMNPEEIQTLAEAAVDRMNAEGMSDLIRYIQNSQRSRQEDERNQLLEKWREEAAKLGLQVRLEPIGASSGRRMQGGPGRMVAPKFRGPNGETWSGRGIKPKWLSALEASGREKEEFRIS